MISPCASLVSDCQCVNNCAPVTDEQRSQHVKCIGEHARNTVTKYINNGKIVSMRAADTCLEVCRETVWHNKYLYVYYNTGSMCLYDPIHNTNTNKDHTRASTRQTYIHNDIQKKTILYDHQHNLRYVQFTMRWQRERHKEHTTLHMPCNRLYNKRLLTLQDQWRQNKINIAGARRAWSQNGWAGVLGEGQYCGKSPAHQQGVWRSTVKAPTMGSELRCMLGSLGELLSCSPAMQNGV